MELAVLAKAVPLSEQLRYDPARRSMRRDGVALVLNPFDQRALRVALELRRPGERVTVIALGPPAARPLLREARALGADRALHLCDDAFAGSDVLATAFTLSAAVRSLGDALVLAGARSTDSDTGLVAPAVAGFLGVPVVTGARTIRRGADGTTLSLDRDTARGHASAVVRAPAVVSVGEKIAKPLHVEEAAFARIGDAGVETLTPGSIGLSAGEVGSFASPTTVTSIAEVAPRRRGQRFDAGTVPARAAAALAVLEEMLAVAPPPPSPLPWPAAYDPSSEIALLASDEGGRVAPAAAGLTTHLRRSVPGCSVTAVVVGPEPSAAESRSLALAGARSGHLIPVAAGEFDAGDAARAVAAFVGRHPKLAAVVAPASPFGREVAGQLAAARRLGTVADAIGVASLAEGGLEWTKPSFGGRTIAGIRCRSTPTVATMADGLAAPATEPRDDGLRWYRAPAPSTVRAVAGGEEVLEEAPGPALESAEVVVAVGMGIGGPEGIDRLRPVLESWGAAVVGTRRVVDAGWLPGHRQLGLTGRWLAPRLAVLLGVRGSINHMIGWQRAGTVLAVNRDPEAEVFRAVDVGIVAAIDEALTELTAPLARLLRRSRPADRA